MCPRASPGAAADAVEEVYEPVQVEQRVLDEKEQIGRNDPCWCGSGKKFKKCHGARSASGLRDQLKLLADYL